MSRGEKYAWASLVMLGGVFWWFQMRMLDGWTIVDQPASELLAVYFAVITAATILEIVIAALIVRPARGEAVERDERDRLIEARAGEVERWVIIVGVNILVWQALWEGVLDGRQLPKIDVAHLPTLFFVLFAILFAGEAAKRVATIVQHRL